MTKQKGYVGWSGSRNFRGKTLWSFRVKDVDAFFGCGESDPKVFKGDLIEFDYEERDGGYVVNTGSIVRVPMADSVSAGRPISAPRPNYQSGGKSASQKDEYWNDKLSRDLANDKYRAANDIKIQHQSARNASIEWVAILVSSGAVKIPEKNGKAVLDGLLADYTNKFFDATSNIGEVVETETTEIPYNKEVA